MAVTPGYVGSAAITWAASATATVAGQSIGTAAWDRIVVVAVTVEETATINTCTIGGVTANVGIAVRNTTGTPDNACAFFWLPVSAGTTANVVVTLSATSSQVGRISVWAMTGAHAALADSNSAQGAGATQTLGGVTIAAGGAGFWVFNNATTGTAVAWTNATERDDTSVGNYRHSVADSVTAGTATITADGATTNQILAGISFNPSPPMGWDFIATDTSIAARENRQAQAISILSASGCTWASTILSTVPPAAEEFVSADVTSGFAFRRTLHYQALVQPVAFSPVAEEFVLFDVTTAFPLQRILQYQDIAFSPRAAAAQTITPELFTESDTFYAPQINLILTPGLFTETDTFYAPVLFYDQVITPALFTDTDTFYAPSVNTTITPDLFTETDTFYAPIVALAITPNLFTEADTFYAPTLHHTITPALFTETDTFYAPTIVLYLTPGIFTETDTFYAPTINLILTPDLYTDTDTFYAPTIVLIVTPNLFTETDTFYAPTIIFDQFITPALFTETDIFYAPAVFQAGFVLPGLFDEGDTFYAPTINYTIRPALATESPVVITSADTLGGNVTLGDINEAAWTNVYNVTEDDANYATVSLLTDDRGDELIVSGFGTLVPDNAIVDSVRVIAQLHADVSGSFDLRFRVYNSIEDGLEILNNVTITTTPTNFGVTGEDLWEISLTPAELNASTFAISFDAQNESGATKVLSCDAVWVRVTYHAAVETFYTPTIIFDQVLTPNRFTETDTFYAPSVSVTIAPSLFTETDVFYAPVVAFAQTITPDLYTETDTFYAPTFVFLQTITPDLYTETDTFYAPNVLYNQTLNPDLYTEEDLMYNPVIAMPGRRVFMAIYHTGLS